MLSVSIQTLFFDGKLQSVRAPSPRPLGNCSSNRVTSITYAPPHATTPETIVCPSSGIDNPPAGAMTTPFTVPSECSYPLVLGREFQTSTCAPPGWETDAVCLWGIGRLYWSPGVCSYGYTTVSLITTPTAIAGRYTVKSEESAAYCCPA